MGNKSTTTAIIIKHTLVRSILMRLNIGVIFFLSILHYAQNTMDFVSVFGFIYLLPFHPIYAVYVFFSFVNFIFASYCKTEKKLVHDIILRFVMIVFPWMVFLLFQCLTALVSERPELSLLSVIGYFASLLWAGSLIFVVGRDYILFNRIYIDYWINVSFLIMFLSLVLYFIGYSPAGRAFTAVVPEIKSIIPGYHAMRGVLDRIVTSYFICIGSFLFFQKNLNLRGMVVMLICFVSIILMMKRTGMLILFSGFVIIAITVKNFKARIASFCLLAFGCIVLLSLYKDEIMYIVQVGGTQTSWERSSRAHWSLLAEYILSKAPIIGVGLGNSDILISKLAHVSIDNSFLDILAAGGVIGLSLFLFWMLMLGFYFYKRKNLIYGGANFMLIALFTLVSLTGNWIHRVSEGFSFLLLLLICGVMLNQLSVRTTPSISVNVSPATPCVVVQVVRPRQECDVNDS